MQAQQTSLYLLVTLLVSFVVLVAVGGGLFEQQLPSQFQWQHKVFAMLCHQLPERSYWINGQPMAVCSRCFGLYAGFALSWFLLPLWSIGEVGAKLPIKKIVLVAVAINFFDIIGNILGFWENTLVSRLILGWLVGWTVVFLFSGDFFKST